MSKPAKFWPHSKLLPNPAEMSCESKRTRLKIPEKTMWNQTEIQNQLFWHVLNSTSSI